MVDAPFGIGRIPEHVGECDMVGDGCRTNAPSRSMLAPAGQLRFDRTLPDLRNFSSTPSARSMQSLDMTRYVSRCVLLLGPRGPHPAGPVSSASNSYCSETCTTADQTYLNSLIKPLSESRSSLGGAKFRATVGLRPRSCKSSRWHQLWPALCQTPNQPPERTHARPFGGS